MRLLLFRVQVAFLTTHPFDLAVTETLETIAAFSSCRISVGHLSPLSHRSPDVAFPTSGDRQHLRWRNALTSTHHPSPEPRSALRAFTLLPCPPHSCPAWWPPSITMPSASASRSLRFPFACSVAFSPGHGRMHRWTGSTASRSATASTAQRTQWAAHLAAASSPRPIALPCASALRPARRSHDGIIAATLPARPPWCARPRRLADRRGWYPGTAAGATGMRDVMGWVLYCTSPVGVSWS